MNKKYNLTLVTEPPVEPLELAEVMEYLKVDDVTDPIENAYVQSLIVVAREYCEGYQHRAYITQTWEMAIDKFPCASSDAMNDYRTGDIIEIPKGKLQKINSIIYKDIYGKETTMLENIDYVVSNRGILGRTCPPYGMIFPCMPLFPLDPIIINFTCGYGDEGSKVPTKVKQAMYLLISHWHDNRAVVSDLRSVDPTKEMAFTVTTLLMMERITIL